MEFALSNRHQHANAPHPIELLRARRERPRDSRAAEQRDRSPRRRPSLP
jgi:hypothetical protein